MNQAQTIPVVLATKINPHSPNFIFGKYRHRQCRIRTEKQAIGKGYRILIGQIRIFLQPGRSLLPITGTIVKGVKTSIPKIDIKGRQLACIEGQAQ
ncbi:hypothetical protein SDC9_97804 [bioreactor metagenome]|uniref:Uncharacterized protein n=1 Tax=bioreactor metagenome TaxID=1076179 RepID=A0A645AEC2_9ZZZZ